MCTFLRVFRLTIAFSGQISLQTHNTNSVHFSRSHQLYYMFGFIFIVTVILVITCSETTVLLCYFHLAAEVSFIEMVYCWALCLVEI